MLFFTSDLHLGCDEVLERESRPFASIREFEDVFVDNVNRVASADDRLFVIGDWFNYNSTYKPDPSVSVSIVGRIAPKIVLITGNGEDRIVRELFSSDFGAFRAYCISQGYEDVLPDCELSFGGRAFYLNHYPSRHRDGYVNLFGHTHRGTGLWKPYGLNVGIDLNHFRPFSEGDILELVKTKEEWWDSDVDCNCM